MKALPFLPQTFNNTLKKQVRINLMTVYKEYNDVKKSIKKQYITLTSLHCGAK